MDTSEYCREIETYLCRKNDGHLIRVVGPTFELVSRWASDGVPLKVAFAGIDRYFERYYRKGARRRPVRVDFCEADVLDVFDEWRRAVGVASAVPDETPSAGAAPRRGSSLPEHLERVLLRLTNARAVGTLAADADDLIDRMSRELDLARGSPAGLRGAARSALVDRLAAADAELAGIASRGLGEAPLEALGREVDADLERFREQMAADVYSRARDLAINRLVLTRLGLPAIAFH